MKTMKKGLCLLLAGILSILLCACTDTKENKEAVYMNITAEEAKKIMDTEPEYVILDVRTEEEFAQGHIPGAILIPDYEIREEAESSLPDKDALILVYCQYPGVWRDPGLALRDRHRGINFTAPIPARYRRTLPAPQPE